MVEPTSSAQSRYFPDSRLGELIDLTDSLRNRPTFSQMIDLLDELFVGLLRYERDVLDVTNRVRLPPSTKSPQVWSVARSGGVHICAVERHAASFRASNYLKIFRLYPECVVFVHSNVDQRVRVLLRPRKGNRTYRYRSLTPRSVLGPKSDRTATWTIRLGLLSPDLEEPAHVNYEAFEAALFEPLPELLAMHDPYSWSSRNEWKEGLGIMRWEEQLTAQVRRFLQLGVPETKRRAQGLHVAMLRSFPCYVEGNIDQRVDYDSYRILETNRSDVYRVEVSLWATFLCNGLERKERISFELTIPKMMPSGALKWDGDAWRFRAQAGGSVEWAGEESDLDDADDVEDQDQVEAALEKVIDEELADIELPDEEEKPEVDIFEFLTLEVENNEDSESVFLSLHRGLEYGVTRKLRSLRWYLRTIKREDRITLVEHIGRMIRWWKVRDNPGAPDSMLPHFFIRDYFEPMPEQGFTKSALGKSVWAHSVDFLEDEAPLWHCPVAQACSGEWFLPGSNCLEHPILRDFIAPADGAGWSLAAQRSLDGEGWVLPAARAAFRALTVRNRRIGSRVLVVPGKNRRIVALDNSDLCSKTASDRVVLRRRLAPGKPLIAAPKKRKVVEAGKDSEAFWKVVGDSNLDPSTGFVFPGRFVAAGDPLVARAQPAKNLPWIDELRSIAFFGGDDAPPLQDRDRSWYLPVGIQGIVSEVRFDGEDAAGSGEISVVVDQWRAGHRGMALSSTNGLQGHIRAIWQRHEMPFLQDGRIIDAIVEVPVDEFPRWRSIGRRSVVFDQDGDLLEGGVVLRNVEWVVDSVPRVTARRNFFRRNLHEKPIPSSLETGDELLPILAQLDAHGADKAITHLIRESGSGRTLHAQQNQRKWRLQQLLTALGCGVDFRAGRIDIEPMSTGKRGLKRVEKHTETIHYRTGASYPSGLFDERIFEPLPVDAMNIGGVPWEVLDHMDWQRHQEGLIDRNPHLKGLKLGGGPLRLSTSEDEIGMELPVIEFPEPVLNPLAETVVADFFGISEHELLAVILGQATLTVQIEGDEFAAKVEEIIDVNFLIDQAPAATGVAGLEAGLEKAAMLEPRARYLIKTIWRKLPVLPPYWRPILGGAQFDSSRLISDVNHYYVEAGQAIARVEKVRSRPDILPYLLLITARERLRMTLRRFIGFIDDEHYTVKHRLRNRRLQKESRTPALRGIGDLLSQFMRRQLMLKSRSALPYTVRGSWVATAPVNPVLIPEDHLLYLWRDNIARWMVEEGVCATVLEAQRSIRQNDPTARLIMRQRIETTHAAGYLVATKNVVTPVQVGVGSEDKPLQVPSDLIRKLSLQAGGKVALYLPPGEEEQQEALALVGKSQSLQRFACPQDVVTGVLTQFGHVYLSELEARNNLGVHTRYDAEQRGGVNLGTWMVRELTLWPVDTQRVFVDALQQGQLGSQAPQIQQRFPAVRGSRLLEVATLAEVEFPRGQQPSMLWQLVTLEHLMAAMGGKVSLLTDDFLSRLILGTLGCRSIADPVREPLIRQATDSIEERVEPQDSIVDVVDVFEEDIQEESNEPEAENVLEVEIKDSPIHTKEGDDELIVSSVRMALQRLADSFVSEAAQSAAIDEVN